MKPNAKMIAAFDDLISEKDLRVKLGYSSQTLRRLRNRGKIKN